MAVLGMGLCEGLWRLTVPGGSFENIEEFLAIVHSKG